jgi:hypothetical protein
MSQLVERSYYTHDNGGRAFKVVTLSHDDRCWVNVYKKRVRIASYSPRKVFIGKSPKNHMTSFSGGHGESFDGNSILLHMHDNQYIFIGSSIQSFEAYDQMVRFVSPVGNSDVPYPYAYDASGNAYLFAFNIVLRNSDAINEYIKQEKEFMISADTFDHRSPAASEISDGDPNYYYMENSLLTPDRGRCDWEEEKTDFMFDQFYIGCARYTMSFNIDPEADHDCFLGKSFKEDMVDEHGISVVDKQGHKTMLTKDAYCKIMKDFGEAKGFLAFKNVIMICERD